MKKDNEASDNTSSATSRSGEASADSDDDDEEEEEVGELVKRDSSTVKRSDRRCSSKIFSQARILRMNKMYKYEETNTKTFSWDKMFKFPNVEH